MQGKDTLRAAFLYTSIFLISQKLETARREEEERKRLENLRIEGERKRKEEQRVRVEKERKRQEEMEDERRRQEELENERKRKEDEEVRKALKKRRQEELRREEEEEALTNKRMKLEENERLRQKQLTEASIALEREATGAYVVRYDCSLDTVCCFRRRGETAGLKEVMLLSGTHLPLLRH